MDKFDMIRRVKLQLSGVKIKKEGFPIPSPNSDEDEQAYVSRCISNIIDEYGQEQSAAICYNRWQNQ